MATRHINAAVFAAIAAAVAAGGILASTWSGTPLIGYDDANIFFVYARNLVEGHGFVYNAGGERVEGFTSLSWTLICSAAMAITPRFEVLLLIVNIVVVSLALGMVQRFAARLLVDIAGIEPLRAAAISLALTLALALAPGFVVWNVVSLMDTGLWSALLLASAVIAMQGALPDRPARPFALAMMVTALVVTRPESFLLAPMLTAIAIAIHKAKGHGWAESLRTHAAPLAAFAVSVAAITVWRVAYFGYPLPNTYYAKAGDSLASRLSDGSVYLLDFAVENPAIVIALAAAVWTATAAWSRYRATPEDRRARALLLIQAAMLTLLVAGCLVPVLEGGDHFGFWRMYQPLVPLLAVQGALVTAAIAPSTAVRAAVLAACMALALVPWRLWGALGGVDFTTVAAPGGAWNSPRLEISIAEDMRGIGAAFTRAFPEMPPRVGVIVAGGFAFTYRGDTIDLMGLNNVAMAHSPGPRTGMRNHAAFNHDVFFSLAPDVLLLSLWAPQRPDWFDFPMLSGVFDELPYHQPDYFSRRAASMAIFDGGVLKGLLQRGGQLYAWAAVRPPSGGQWIHAIFKRDFLKQLEGRGYEIALPGRPR